MTAARDDAVTHTLRRLHRATPWELVDQRRLAFDAGHPQGMARIDGTWWISTVDLEARRGWVLAVDDAGRLVDRVAVGDDERYHPGGMGFDGTALWVPCAEYRPRSTTTVVRLVPGGTASDVFEVDDHVGAVVRAGADGDLVGWTWGSRRFRRWRLDGQLVDERRNPGGFVDHQDGHWLDTGHVLCGGVGAVATPAGAVTIGGLALLRADDLVVEHEAPFPGYSPTGRVGTHNPLWVEAVDDRVHLHLLPDDGRGTMLTWATPVVPPG